MLVLSCLITCDGSIENYCHNVHLDTNPFEEGLFSRNAIFGKCSNTKVLGLSSKIPTFLVYHEPVESTLFCAFDLIKGFNIRLSKKNKVKFLANPI